jgi:Abortive infection alpha
MPYHLIEIDQPMTIPDDDAKDALVALGVGPAAKELYVDLLRPAAIETGKNLAVVARLVTIALAPLRGLVWGMEAVQDWLSAALLKRLAGSKTEDIQTPPAYIAGQILLQLPFCAEQEQLREMYANLLASAMRRDIAPQVHPAFVQVIQQLTPDEVLILEAIASEPRGFALQEQMDNYGHTSATSVEDQFLSIAQKVSVAHSELAEAYLENLLRLRIFSEMHWNEGRIVRSHDFVPYDVPPEIENTSGRVIELTVFGRHFLATCAASKAAPSRID